MGFLVGYHIGFVFLLQGGGQVDFRTDDTQNKRGRNVVTNIYSFSPFEAGPHLPPNAEITKAHISQHHGRAPQPDPGQKRHDIATHGFGGFQRLFGHFHIGFVSLITHGNLRILLNNFYISGLAFFHPQRGFHRPGGNLLH